MYMCGTGSIHCGHHTSIYKDTPQCPCQELAQPFVALKNLYENTEKISMKKFSKEPISNALKFSELVSYVPPAAMKALDSKKAGDSKLKLLDAKKAGDAKKETSTARCNHYHYNCPFSSPFIIIVPSLLPSLLLPLLSSNVSTYLPHRRRELSCHQVQPLALSLLFSYNLLSPIMYPPNTPPATCLLLSPVRRWFRSAVKFATKCCRRNGSL